MSGRYELIGTISDTSPAAAGVAVSAVTITGLDAYDEIHVEADLTGAGGDTLGVTIQRKLANNLWRDWISFGTVSASAALAKFSVPPAVTKGIFTVGGGTDATPGVALAANSTVGGHPGTDIRAVYTAAASTSSGAAQVIRVFGRKR